MLTTRPAHSSVAHPVFCDASLIDNELSQQPSGNSSAMKNSLKMSEEDFCNNPSCGNTPTYHEQFLLLEHNYPQSHRSILCSCFLNQLKSMNISEEHYYRKRDSTPVHAIPKVHQCLQNSWLDLQPVDVHQTAAFDIPIWMVLRCSLGCELDAASHHFAQESESNR